MDMVKRLGKSKEEQLNENKINKQFKMTNDGIIALLFTVVIVLLVGISLKFSIFRFNLFQIICGILIVVMLTCIFWKRIKYFLEQINSFLFDIFIVGFVSIFASLAFISSYWIDESNCFCKRLFLGELGMLRCICDNSDLLLRSFLIFVLICLLRFFLLILLLPECKDD